MRYDLRSKSSKRFDKTICSNTADDFPCETTANTKGARGISDTLDVYTMATITATIVRRWIVHTILCRRTHNSNKQATNGTNTNTYDNIQTLIIHEMTSEALLARGANIKEI